MLNVLFKLIAAKILLNKLASEFIASASFCKESNVATGKQTIVLLASNVVENNSFNSVTLLLLITDIECDIKSLELANDTDI